MPSGRPASLVRAPPAPPAAGLPPVAVVPPVTVTPPVAAEPSLDVPPPPTIPPLPALPPPPKLPPFARAPPLSVVVAPATLPSRDAEPLEQAKEKARYAATARLLDRLLLLTLGQWSRRAHSARATVSVRAAAPR